MNLTKSRKILLLIASVFPILYMIAFMIMTFSFLIFSPHGKEQPWIFKNFALVFTMHGAAMLLMLATIIFYLVYIFKSNMDQQMKILWALVIFVGGPIGMLVFWFVNIWPEKLA
jgi:hypothetical protein